MRPVNPVAVWFLFFLAPVVAAVTLTLERVSHTGLNLTQVTDLDRVRQGRLVVGFPVLGSYDIGLYYTRVLLGTPPKEFHVQIETASDVSWVSCTGCSGCSRLSGLDLQLQFFDTSASTTSRLITRSDHICSGAQTSDTSCNYQNQCCYGFQYGDGSRTSGFYVQDFITFDTVFGKTLTTNHSAPIIFGCSTSLAGGLRRRDRAVDGVFGFGQKGLSIISQLASQGVTPNSFSHCFSGESGGGILVLGQIVDPNIVYTPLVPSQSHYNVNLTSISLNGQALSSVSATSTSRGTYFDSGTALVYLAEEAYDQFIPAITQKVSGSARPIEFEGNWCFLTNSSISDIFPQVSLNFAGGATMPLRPEDYLVQQYSVEEDPVWCVGILKNEGQRITILGDLVLKEKIVVYDLAGQRIGWANYDCSLSVNISMSTDDGSTELVNVQMNKSSPVRYKPHKVLPCIMVAFLFHHAFWGQQSPRKFKESGARPTKRTLEKT